MGAAVRLFFSVFVVVTGFLIYKAIEIPDAKIEGWVADGFEDLRLAYHNIFTEKLEKGSSFAAYYRGKLVAHLWAGCKDFFCTEMWQENTTSLIHSTTKSLGALCLAVMADRGHLNYSAPVSKYWPEFSRNGKEKITVDDLLSHRAGLVGVSPPLTFEELERDDLIIGRRLSEQETAWSPGTEVHYHALTIGMYMNELFKRVNPQKRSCVDFLENDIFSPLGLDIKIGLRDSSQKSRYAAPLLSHLRLIARIYYDNDGAPKRVLRRFTLFPNSTYRKIMSPIANTIFGHDFLRSSYVSIPLLSTNGIATSKSLAHLMGILALGGRSSSSAYSFPHELIKSPYVMEQLLEPVSEISWMSSLDEAYFSRGLTILKSPVGSKMIGSPGIGGQMGFADPVKRVGWAYLTNHLSPFSCGDDPRHLHLQRTLYKIIERFEVEERVKRRTTFNS